MINLDNFALTKQFQFGPVLIFVCAMYLMQFQSDKGPFINEEIYMLSLSLKFIHKLCYRYDLFL